MTKVIANIKTGYIKEVVSGDSANIKFTSYNENTGITSHYKIMSLDKAIKIENKWMQEI